MKVYKKPSPILNRYYKPITGMMKKKLVFLLLLLVSVTSFSSTTETLPTHHWAYKIIDEMQARGFLLDLSQLNLPYTRGQIARALVEMEKPNGIAGQWYEMLESEFNPEIHEWIEPVNDQQSVNIRLKVNSNLDHNPDKDLEYKGIYRGGVGINLAKNFYAYSGVNFNQYDVDNPDYVGYEWRGITGYTEQAYVAFRNDRFYLKFGRDFIKWGAGYSGKLVMSDIARPLDMLYAGAKVGPFRYSFFASQLDDLEKYTLDSNNSLPIRRFLSGHRLDVLLWGGKLQASVTELMLYGGAGETFNPVYINPFIFWHGAHKNGTITLGNVLPTLDLLYYINSKFNVYGSLLIDDIQIEKTGPVDLEPNEIGLILGGRIAGPFQLSGLSLLAEYTRVTNRTYKTPSQVETFLQRGKPLGHPLGNDFDHLLLRTNYWLNPGLRLQLDLGYTRHGEGSIYSPWDAPWFNYTIDEGYSEPFPTGVVEKNKSVNFSVLWYWQNYCRMYIQLESDFITNRNNIAEKNDNLFSARFQLEFDYSRIFGIPTH